MIQRMRVWLVGTWKGLIWKWVSVLCYSFKCDCCWSCWVCFYFASHWTTQQHNSVVSLTAHTSYCTLVVVFSFVFCGAGGDETQPAWCSKHLYGAGRAGRVFASSLLSLMIIPRKGFHFVWRFREWVETLQDDELLLDAALFLLVRDLEDSGSWQ